MPDLTSYIATLLDGEQFRVYTNAPIPDVRTRPARGPKVAAKLRMLKINESCIFAAGTSVVQPVQQLKPKQFAVRKVVDGVQVWRIK